MPVFLHRKHPMALPGLAALAFAAGLGLSLTGCKARPAPPSDAMLTSEVNAQMTADPALQGAQVAGQVTGGVAVLTGSVADPAQRTIAARDVAGIQGITRVDITSLGMAPVAGSMAAAPLPAPPPVPSTSLPIPRPRPEPQVRQPAPVERYQPAPQQQAYNPPPSVQKPVEPVAPPPPPKPVFRNVSIPTGTTLPVRITQTLDSASTQTGDSFSGVVASDVVVNGLVVIPQGSAVSGHVDTAQDAGHFKGNSLLTVSLSSIRARGQSLAVTTDPYSVSGKGRGKNTAEKAGGGAVVGAVLGGIFGGGKGAAIGAAAGGGAGAGVNAVTRGQQVQIESESVVRFSISSPTDVRVRTDGASGNSESGLQSRQ